MCYHCQAFIFPLVLNFQWDTGWHGEPGVTKNSWEAWVRLKGRRIWNENSLRRVTARQQAVSWPLATTHSYQFLWNSGMEGAGLRRTLGLTSWWRVAWSNWSWYMLSVRSKVTPEKKQTEAASAPRFRKANARDGKVGWWHIHCTEQQMANQKKKHHPFSKTFPW